MPIYAYQCEQGHEHEVLVAKYEPPRQVACPECGRSCKRHYSGEVKHTDCEDRPRWSEAMGVAPNQIPEAMRRFPGSTYDADGRLYVASRRDKLKKMNERGYVELD